MSKLIDVLILPDGRMDTKNSSTYLGLSEKTMAMWRCEGKGPPFVKRGRIFYFKDDLDEWISDGRVASTVQAFKETDPTADRES